MGNVGSADGNGRRRQGFRRSQTPPPPPPPMITQPDIMANHYIFPGTAPLPGQYHSPNPNIPPGYFHQYPPPPPPGYYPHHPPVLPMPMPVPYDHHHRVPHLDQTHSGWAATARCPYWPPQPPPYVEHQKAMTIRNDVNLKKDSLRVEKDEENSGKYLVAFNFDATVAGSITIMFFAKEREDCDLKPLKESLLPPLTIEFEAGLGQKFLQPAGTGIDFSMFEESELLKVRDVDAYPLAVKAETHPPHETDSDGKFVLAHTNSQITHAVFEKEKGEYIVKVVKQILWVNGTRYELQEIYGIGNSAEGETANDLGKECVICLSEPTDTTVLPCRHMCMCSGCAKVLRFQTNRCPICRQPVERLLEIKVGNDSEGG